MKKLFNIEVFKTNDMVRYSTEWYGVGRHNLVFHNNVGYPGKTYFLNCYRKAPIRITHFRCFGVWKDEPKHLASLYFSGSRVEPYHSWYFRVGRMFVGGETPKGLISGYKRFQRWQWLREAKRTGEGLCLACENGLIVCKPGYPGEYLEMCDNKKCHRVFQTYFNKYEIQ